MSGPLPDWLRLQGLAVLTPFKGNLPVASQHSMLNDDRLSRVIGKVCNVLVFNTRF